jgi:hypothetical protein
MLSGSQSSKKNYNNDNYKKKQSKKRKVVPKKNTKDAYPERKQDKSIAKASTKIKPDITDLPKYISPGNIDGFNKKQLAIDRWYPLVYVFDPFLFDMVRYQYSCLIFIVVEGTHI